MNIVAVSKYLFPPIGGAEISMLEILKRLACEHKVSILCQGSGAKGYSANVRVMNRNISTPFLRGQWIQQYVENLRWRRVVRKTLVMLKADVLFTQLDYSAPAILAANDINIPSLLFIRSFEYFCLLDYESRLHCDGNCPYCLRGWKEKIQIPFAKKIYKMRQNAFLCANRVVANSLFMAQKCLEHYGRKVDVIYPFGWDGSVIGHECNENSRRGYITMITPMIHKGVDVFMEIVQRMPKRNFLAVGRTTEGVRAKMKFLDNLTYIPWTDDKKKIYSKSSLLIVPSLWEEAFGRVCVEAMGNGVPCIVSDRGGLPEAVADAGVVINDPNNIELWIGSIERILNNKNLRSEMVNRGKEHVRIFDSHSSFVKLQKIIEEMKK